MREVSARFTQHLFISIYKYPLLGLKQLGLYNYIPYDKGLSPVNNINFAFV